MSAVNLIARIPCPVENLTAVQQLLEEYGAHVRTMDGAERFEVYRAQDADEVVVLERYRDQQAFAEHMADPANKVLNDRLGELTPTGSALTFLRA
ncbi:antibiotic biosynthesis monooxygenase family protein [Actinomyces sp. F1_1611]